MTQPAKVQEPSMEEILASIRRIIADDEAKPPAAEKACKPARRPRPEKPARRRRQPSRPSMNDIPPSAIARAQAAAPRRRCLRRRAGCRRAGRPRPTARTTSTRCWRASTRRRPEAEIRPPLPDGEVFELTDEMALPDPPPPAASPFHKVDPEDDLEFTEAPRPARRTAQPRIRTAAASKAPPAPPQQQMLSRSTVSAVESAFNTLANTVLSNNARTLEDLVKEMLRPMLKSWLDDNLPGLVERIVKAEIERVSRGR